MKPVRPHIYFRDGMWNCRGHGQMLSIVGTTARTAYLRWAELVRLIESGRVL